jgi:hypothetical protein
MYTASGREGLRKAVQFSYWRSKYSVSLPRQQPFASPRSVITVSGWEAGPTDRRNASIAFRRMTFWKHPAPQRWRIRAGDVWPWMIRRKLPVRNLLWSVLVVLSLYLGEETLVIVLHRLETTSQERDKQAVPRPLVTACSAVTSVIPSYKHKRVRRRHAESMERALSCLPHLRKSCENFKMTVEFPSTAIVKNVNRTACVRCSLQLVCM